MTQEVIAYTWEIAGRKASNPDVFYETAQAKGFNLERIPLNKIDCSRGAKAGAASLLMSKEDASAVVALTGPQTIIVRKLVQTIATNWSESERYEFKGYYVLGTKDAFGVDENSVYVELTDARYVLEQTFVHKRFNVRRKSSEYDPETLSIDDAPYTYQQVLNSILSVMFSPPTLTIPVSYAEPENLIFDCSLADAIDQLLASLGCILAYDPLSGSYRIVNLISPASFSATTAARNEGRLIEKTNVKAASGTLPDKVNIRPAGIAALASNGVELPARTIPISIGLGTETVAIEDHQITCDTTRILNAVSAWFDEQNYLLDETYQGIVKQAPAEHISSVLWFFEAGATKTRVRNMLPGKMPWPKQPILASSTVTPIVVFTLNSDLSEPGSAFATVVSDSSGELSPGTAISVIGLIEYDAETGDYGVAAKVGELYYVIELPEIGTDYSLPKPAFLVQGILDTRPGSSTSPQTKFPAWAGDSTAYVDSGSLVTLSPAPYTFLTPFSTCTNPHGLNGEIGDTFIAVRNPTVDPEEWILTNVYSKKATIFFKLTADRVNTGNFDSNTVVNGYDNELAVSVVSWRHSGAGPTEDSEDPEDDDGESGAGTLRVQDTFLKALNARVNDVGFAEWNASIQKWSVLGCQHYASDIRGFTTSIAWKCNPDCGYDGYINTADSLDVSVPAGWEHPGTSKSIWFKLNPATGNYEAYQLEAECDG